LKGETLYSIVLIELNLAKLERETLVKRRLSISRSLTSTKSNTLEIVIVEFV